MIEASLAGLLILCRSHKITRRSPILPSLSSSSVDLSGEEQLVASLFLFFGSRSFLRLKDEETLRLSLLHLIVRTPLFESKDNSYVLAWTTTPWTLPSNLGLCVNPELKCAWGAEQHVMPLESVGKWNAVKVPSDSKQSHWYQMDCWKGHPRD